MINIDYIRIRRSKEMKLKNAHRFWKKNPNDDKPNNTAVWEEGEDISGSKEFYNDEYITQDNKTKEQPNVHESEIDFIRTNEENVYAHNNSNYELASDDKLNRKHNYQINYDEEENFGSVIGSEADTDVEQEEEHEHKKIGSFWDFLLFISRKVDALGVESNGIDRIKPEERGTLKTQLLHVTGIWLSATGGLSSMSSFLLGPLVFSLTFNESCVSGLISMLIGCLVAAYCSMMGPQSGCRQMVTARYLFGWWFVKFVALAAILGVMGWSVVNSVVGGEMLAVISNNKVPLWVGILIVTLCSFVVAIFGIKQVLKVETYLALPVLTSFLLLYISASNKYSEINVFKNDDIPRINIKGSYMSFFSLCYSVTSTWGSITADYYILFPEEVPKYYIFLLTFFGIAIPTTFVAVLGLILGAIAMSYKPWNELYTNYGMGGLLWAGFERWNGFGKFCVVVLIFSLVSNNIVNTYSAAFSIQLSSLWCARVPRWCWCIVCTVVYLVCALAGRNHFSTILGNFLPMIGYWITMYFTLLFEENEIFRRFYLHMYTKEFPPTKITNDETYGEIHSGNANDMMMNNARDNSNEYILKEGYKKENVITNIRRLKRKQKINKIRYNWDKWDDPEVLTHGYAATFATLCGIAGVVVGMAQVYWIGPVARHFGEYGGDLAMWLSMGICSIVYPPLRYLELKHFGR